MPTTVAMPGRPKLRFTLLPPPRNRADSLAAVDIAKAAEVSSPPSIPVSNSFVASNPAECRVACLIDSMLCHGCSPQVVLAVLPGQAKAVCMDSAGQQALGVLRQMGMPALLGLVTGGRAAGNAAAMLKEKAAARKRAAAVLQSEVCCNSLHAAQRSNIVSAFIVKLQLIRSSAAVTHRLPGSTRWWRWMTRRTARSCCARWQRYMPPCRSGAASGPACSRTPRTSSLGLAPSLARSPSGALPYVASEGNARTLKISTESPCQSCCS